MVYSTMRLLLCLYVCACMCLHVSMMSMVSMVQAFKRTLPPVTRLGDNTIILIAYQSDSTPAR